MPSCPTLKPPEMARRPAGQVAVAVVPVESGGTLTAVPATIETFDALMPPSTPVLKRVASRLSLATLFSVTELFASLAALTDPWASLVAVTALFASLGVVTALLASLADVTDPLARVNAATPVPASATTMAATAIALAGVR